MKEDFEKILKDNTVCTVHEEDGYTHMKYPKFLPLMRFDVDRYHVEGFGDVMSMHTTTKMGMELLTLSFMPGEGVLIPYLLIDAMSMKKKRCVFVEYYGCGREELHDEKLKEVYEPFKDLPEYEEKENWYIRERRPYSLIKSGSEEELLEMTKRSVEAYLLEAKEAPVDQTYREDLKTFRERMIIEGNPSSKTLEMLLKKDGAVCFMKEVVMPVRD